MLDEDDEELAQVPASALTVMKILADQLRAVDAHLSAIDEEIEAWQRESSAAQALKTIPGVGADQRGSGGAGSRSLHVPLGP
jgi:transposase